LHIQGNLCRLETVLKKFSDFVKIASAAEYISVSPRTFKIWESVRKLIAHHEYPIFGNALDKLSGLS